MELHRIIKSDARRALRRYWAKSAVAALTVFSAYLAIILAESVLMFVFSDESDATLNFLNIGNTNIETLVINGIVAFAFVLLIPALIIGYKRLHLSFAEGRKTAVATLFDCFASPREYFNAIGLTACLCVRGIFVTLLAAAPGGGLIYAAYRFIEPQNRTVYMLKLCAYCVGGILMLLCLALALIFMQRWFAAPYYLASGKGFSESFSLSVKATKGLCPQIIRFKISFFGWALLSGLILPMLWTLPYYSTAKAIYAKYLMQRLERNTANAVNPLEHQQNEASANFEHGANGFEHGTNGFEHGTAADESVLGENEHAAAPDSSFYAQSKPAACDFEHANGEAERATGDFEHGAAAAEPALGENEHAAAPDSSFYAQSKPAACDFEHGGDEAAFSPLSPEQAAVLSNSGKGKSPSDFVEKIKSLADEDE